MGNSRSWAKRAGEAARSYRENTAELKRRRAAAVGRRGFAAPEAGARGIIKPVEAAALRIAEDRRLLTLERETEAVEWAFSQLGKVSGGEEIAKLAQLLYRSGDKMSVERAGYELHLSRPTAYRYNRAFLKLVAARLGVWSPPE